MNIDRMSREELIQTLRASQPDVETVRPPRSDAPRAAESEDPLRAQLEAVDRAVTTASMALARAPGMVTAPFLQVIADEARVLAHAKGASLRLQGESTPLEAQSGMPEPALGALHGLRLPIRYANRDLGELALWNPAHAPFSEAERQAVQRFVERVGFALEIARLKAVESAERQRLSVLADTARELSLVLNVQAAQAAVAGIGDLLVPRLADFSLIFLVEGQELKLARAAFSSTPKDAGDPRIDSDLRFRLDCPLMLHLSEHKQSLLFPTYDTRFCGKVLLQEPNLIRTLERLDTKSLLLLPLTVHTTVFGLMVLGCTSSRRYDSRDRGVADEVAFRCALALQSAQLYERAQMAVQLQEDLLAIVSHDLRSPLNAISLSAKLLHPLKLSEQRRTNKQMATIARSVDRMHRLIDHLLTATSIEAGRFTIECRQVDAEALVEDAVENARPLAEGREVRLEAHIPAQLGAVYCDRDRIFQVFSNLFGNAIKFTPAGGTVSIEARASADEVCFTISDSGPGIPKSHMPHLFDRYWKGSAPPGRGGFGLGLFIVKSVVDAHGARLWVDSEPGHGSRFSFTLPRPSAE